MSGSRKEASRRFLDEAFNQGRLDVVDELVAPEFVSHDPGVPSGETTGPEAVKELIAGYRAAFPDLHLTIDDQIEEGDRVATRWTAVGTHDGDFWGMEPTGRQATVRGITIDRYEGERAVESWSNWDTFGLLTQLGIVPAQATASTS